MPGFCWDVRLDLALCLQVFSLRPQSVADWEKVASTIKDSIISAATYSAAAGSSSAEGSMLHMPKARGCKERMQLLIKKYKEEDKRSLKSCEIECNLVDTGAVQRVPLSNVCSSSPPMISYMAAQALHCTLVDIQPTRTNQWSDRTITRFQQLVSAVGPKQALVFSNQDRIWPVSIIVKNDDKWTPVSKLLGDEQLAIYVPMFHVVEAVEALSSTQSNPVHSFPAQTQQPVMSPCGASAAASPRHKEGKVPASSSKQVDANDAKSGYDKKDDDSLDSDDEWDNSLLPPVSKGNAEDTDKQRKKNNLQACYSALMENVEQFKSNSTSNALSPNQRPQHGKNARSNRRRSSPLDQTPVGNYPKEPAYPFPQQIPHGNRGRGMRRGGRGGGRGMEQGRWYGPGTPYRQVDRRFSPEFNPVFRPQFGTIPHPPPPPPYYPSPPPPHGLLPPPMPDPMYREGGLPKPTNVVALTEQTMKNEVNWLSWRIENDIKKMTGQSVVCQDMKVFTGEIYKIMTTSNALKLFNLAGSDAPFRAVLKALLNQVLLKPALVKIVVHAVIELYEYSIEGVSNSLQPLLEETAANLDEDKCSTFCTFLAKLFFSSIGNDSESIFPPAASIIRHFLDSWVRCSSEKSPSDAKLFATLCEEVGPILDSVNKETLDEYFKSVVRNNILKESLSRTSREVLLDLTVKRAVWIEAQKTTPIGTTQKLVLTGDKPQTKAPIEESSEDKSDSKLPHDENTQNSTTSTTTPSTSGQPVLTGPSQPLPSFPAHPLAHFPSNYSTQAPHFSSSPPKYHPSPRPPNITPHPPSPRQQAQSYAQPFHSPVRPAAPVLSPSTPLPPPRLPPPSRVSAHHPPPDQDLSETVSGDQASQHMKQQPVFTPTSQPSTNQKCTAYQQLAGDNDQVSSVPQHSLTEHTKSLDNDPSHALQQQQQQSAKSNGPTADPYSRITRMLQELDLSRLVDNFHSSMIKDRQLLAPKDDLKSALKEAGIPPGAVLAIIQYLDDRPNTEVSSQKLSKMSAAGPADSCVPSSKDQQLQYTFTQLPAHQITTTSLPPPLPPTTPPPHQLESLAYPAQYGQTHSVTQPANLPPSQPAFHQPPQHSHPPPSVQPQDQFTQPQPGNQPTPQPQLVVLNNEVPVTQSNKEQPLRAHESESGSVKLQPRVLLPPSKQQLFKDGVHTPTSTQANVSAKADSSSRNQVSPQTKFGSKGSICSLCGSCQHQSSYCPQRNDLLFRSHVD